MAPAQRDQLASAPQWTAHTAGEAERQRWSSPVQHRETDEEGV